MAGARAQHPLGNRETPRIAAGIFPIGGASVVRMRRYFFRTSRPGRGRRQWESRDNGRSRNNAGIATPEMPDNAARHANRQAGATCRTGGGQRASHSRKQKAGSRRRAAGGRRHTAESGRRAGSNPSGRRQHRASRRFHVHTNSPQRPHDAHTGTAAAPGTGNRRSLRNRADSAPAKIMQANRYYPQRYRKSSE